MKSIKILMLTKYGRLGASSRMRSYQYLPWFERAGFEIDLRPLLSDRMLQTRYAQGGHSKFSLLRAYGARLNALLARGKFDLLWIEKEALPWLPVWLEIALLQGVPYVLDYDDAIFHNYDQHRIVAVRRLFGRRLDSIMARAALVVGGNNYLAQRARDAGATWVEVLPTVIDLRRYFPKERDFKKHSASFFRIVWIGSPSTVQYLQILEPVLRSLAERYSFVLRIIGGGRVDFRGVQIESVVWEESTEAENIGECDIGIMPLKDSPWELGKCGYKLIQYMASGLPVVASDVGVNSEIVKDGECGFVVGSNSEWYIALSKLLENSSLRMQMGSAGRQRVEKLYCVQKTGPQLVDLLNRAAIGC